MKDLKFIVAYNKPLTENVFEMKLNCAEGNLPTVKCGQFLHMQIPGNAQTLLRRPFCLCKFDEKSVTLIIAKVGKGTEKIAEIKAGETVKAIMPVGNGFTLEEGHKRIVLLGGGIGSAPLLAVPQTYPGKKYFSYLGYSTKSAVLLEKDFTDVSETVICTDDGSYGVKGFATQALKCDLDKIKPDVILVCGPTPMFKAAALLSYECKVPAYVSVEARMGCGVGACLVCTCGVREKDGSLSNKRACVDGPVFKLEDLVL